MTTVDNPVVPRSFPPITLEQMRNGRCAGGHRLPQNPTYLIRRGGQVYCPACSSSHRRVPGSGQCVNGHDITKPDALLPDNRCRECRRERQRVYSRLRRQQRARPPVATGELAPTARSARPEYLGLAVPSREIRMWARCGPSTAHLFDKRRAHESKSAAEKRHRKAAALCETCSVLSACARWYKNEPRNTGTVAALGAP